MIRSIFLYLDRTYLMQTPGVKNLWDTGLDLFREYIVEEPSIKKGVIQGILLNVEKDRYVVFILQIDSVGRKGEQIPKTLIRSLIRMFQDLSIYFSVLESPLIKATSSFYSAYAKSFVDSFTSSMGGSHVSGYVMDTFTKLESEGQRCDPLAGYLDISSRKRLVSVIDREMVEKHAGFLLDKGFKDLVNEDRLDDLAKLYQLLGRVSALDLIRKHFAEYIKVRPSTC